MTPTALLGVVDDDGRLTSVVVLVLAPNGVGGSIVVLPASADARSGSVTIASRSPRPTPCVDPRRSPSRPRRSPGSRSTSSRSSTQARLAEIVAPLGELEVDLPADVVDDDSDEPLSRRGR